MRRWVTFATVLSMLSWPGTSDAGLFSRMFGAGGGECAGGACGVSGGGAGFSMPVMSVGGGYYGAAAPVYGAGAACGAGGACGVSYSMPVSYSAPAYSYGAAGGSCYSSSVPGYSVAYSRPTYSAPVYYAQPQAQPVQQVLPTPQVPSKTLPNQEYTPAKAGITTPDALKGMLSKAKLPLVRRASLPAEKSTTKPRASIDCGCGGDGGCECGDKCQCERVPVLKKERTRTVSNWAPVIYESMSHPTVDYSGMNRETETRHLVDYSGFSSTVLRTVQVVKTASVARKVDYDGMSLK